MARNFTAGQVARGEAAFALAMDAAANEGIRLYKEGNYEDKAAWPSREELVARCWTSKVHTPTEEQIDALYEWFVLYFCQTAELYEAGARAKA